MRGMHELGKGTIRSMLDKVIVEFAAEHGIADPVPRFENGDDLPDVADVRAPVSVSAAGGCGLFGQLLDGRVTELSSGMVRAQVPIVRQMSSISMGDEEVFLGGDSMVLAKPIDEACAALQSVFRPTSCGVRASANVGLTCCRRGGRRMMV